MRFRSKILTIILLTYNRVEYLKKSLSAILSQTYTDFELLVVDNHSSDDTAKLMISYNDSRLQYIRLGPNGSPTCGHTFAMKLIESKYVLITHDDDIMNQNMVQEQLHFLKRNKNIIVLSSNVSLIDQNDKVIQNKLYNIENNIIFSKNKYIEEYIKNKFWLPAPTTIFKTTIYKQIRKKFSPMPSSDILELFLMNLQGSIAILSQPLLKYRQHNTQESRLVNQSEPHVILFKETIKHTKNNKYIKNYLPSIYAIYIKYKIQDKLFKHTNNLIKIKNSLTKLKAFYIKNISLPNRKIDEIIIFEILLLLFGEEIINKSIKLKSNSIISSSYLKWLKKLSKNKSIFSKQRSYNRIAILGSMLTAFMIVQDAKNNNIEVVNCLDSSIQRIGNNVLGVDIISLDNINDIENNIDAIILSSEREHDEALKKIIQDKLNNKDLPIISWKEML